MNCMVVQRMKEFADKNDNSLYYQYIVHCIVVDHHHYMGTLDHYRCSNLAKKESIQSSYPLYCIKQFIFNWNRNRV